MFLTGMGMPKSNVARYYHLHQSSPTRRTLQHELAADTRGALAHAEEPEVSIGNSGGLVRIEAFSVVADPEGQTVGETQLDTQPTRLRVADRVPNRFVSDAKNFVMDYRMQLSTTSLGQKIKPDWRPEYAFFACASKLFRQIVAFCGGSSQ